MRFYPLHLHLQLHLHLHTKIVEALTRLLKLGIDKLNLGIYDVI